MSWEYTLPPRGFLPLSDLYISYGRQILGTALVANEVIEDIRRGQAEDLFVIKIKLDIKNPYELW